MSFTVHARRVRDERLSPARRGAALGSAIVLYGPFGFTWTRSYLGLFGDTRRDPRAMVRALEALERSRNARRAEWAEFSRRRTIEKHEAHRRTPTAADRAWMAAPRWPGPDLHHAHRAMVLRWSCLPVPPPAELRREGLTTWTGPLPPRSTPTWRRTGRTPRRQRSWVHSCPGCARLRRPRAARGP
ncbi:hypothetical protein [Streptomyces sp. AB3(2024)]|uniref:hypothetical protein n=1 Tax=Streptomyces sp. AB3(2024) TaxID=3317321 RepID=UPI0035A27EE1